MQIVCWYNIAKQYFRSFLSAVSIFATFIGLLLVYSQTAKSELPVDRTIIKSGKFMAREHLVIDLQSSVEWMRCTVGQVWNGSGC